MPVGWEDDQDESGCVYILDECDGRRICGALRQAEFILLPAASCGLPCRQRQRGRSRPFARGGSNRQGRRRPPQSLWRQAFRAIPEAARAGCSRFFATQMFMICSKV